MIDAAFANWEAITNGESGAVVRRSPDGTRFAKAVSAVGIVELMAERDRIVWLGAQGVSGPTVLDWFEGADDAVLVMSAVPGVSADRLAVDDLATAWPGIGEAIRRLHGMPVAECPFREHDLAARMALARNVVARRAVNPDFLPDADRMLAPEDILAELESAVPSMLARDGGDLVVCHGDCCLPNIMIDPETLRVTGFVDLGRLGVADRHADLALLTANARETWLDETAAQRADSLLADADGVPFDAERLAFYLRLDPLTWG